MFPGENAIRHLRTMFLTVGFVCLASSYSEITKSSKVAGSAPQTHKNWERERERAYNRQQFNKNFHDLQILGQNLLKEHEARRLTSERLAKDSKSISKCAKTLRSLTALGSLAMPQKINKNINTPQEYDESIRRLAKYIWDFAHNPHHQNSKVFNTDHASRAQTDLLAIIGLSKAIENRAKGYLAIMLPAQ